MNLTVLQMDDISTLKGVKKEEKTNISYFVKYSVFCWIV